MSNFTVISFYTPNGIYQHMAERLMRTCYSFNIPYVIQKMNDKGSWVKNCNQKANFIHSMLKELNTKLVWIDSDAVFKKDPVLLNNSTAEFAIRAEPGKATRKQVGREEINLPINWPKSLGNIWFNSGTMLFSPSQKTNMLIERWIELGEKYPSNWDQWNLQQAWSDIQPSTEWLPREYCQIHKLHGNKNAVILHDLASVIQKVDRK